MRLRIVLISIAVIILGFSILYGKLQMRLQEQKDIAGSARVAHNEETAVKTLKDDDKKRIAISEYGYIENEGIYFTITNPESLYGQ